ncbi:MAG: SOS response-associated peptidase [Candidatus Neomarinimicrobiota bacterium]|nr:MAG: SOS response-associated peptidase [Candidatus Neomarinimicrobiota bacterium]
MFNHFFLPFPAEFFYFHTMCGRKTLTRDMQSIIEELAVEEWEDPEAYVPSYNIAPTQRSPILLFTGHRTVRLMRWGLIPRWAKDARRAAHLINARVETVLEKPSFRPLIADHRCIVIADGYYEWKREGPSKQPFYFRHPEGKLLLMAGLWDGWTSPEDEVWNTYTIITKPAIRPLAHIHTRMPVILPPEIIDTWLRPGGDPSRDLLPLLNEVRPRLQMYAVSSRVNSPRNNSPECILPLHS